MRGVIVTLFSDFIYTFAFYFRGAKSIIKLLIQRKGMQRMKENHKHTIYAKRFISEKEYYELKQLQSLCFHKDKTNLKLELEYKLFISNTSKEKSEILSGQSTQKEKVKQQIETISTNNPNEFLYYIDDTLVGYLGISCFGRKIGEINGMTHPDWRGKGIFHTLFDLVAKECQGRDFSKVLLLSDENSQSGIAFIQSVGGIYDSSEYGMKLLKNPTYDETSPVNLRIADKLDKKKIAQQNTIFFEDDEDEECTDTAPNTDIYMVEVAENVIGKIQIEYSDNAAFIFGFGILPDYRRKGYGKATLIETLRIIADKNIVEVGLDVVCTNSNALNLYISCGFEQQSVMKYYRYPINSL